MFSQPAKEGGRGGHDGALRHLRSLRMHNTPGLPIGQFAIRKRPIMAATDEFNITTNLQFRQ
jgi:metal-dependent amidase/aminoacylase/carboxypeptidase family protein